MKTKRKLLLTFLVASFVLVAVVATLAITFALTQQTIKTTLNISYSAEDIDGTVSATYTMREETKNLIPQADADHISEDGKSLIFKATDTENAGSLEFPNEALEFTKENNNVIIQYTYTNTGDKHYTATMSFDAELTYENMVVEYGIWDFDNSKIKYSRNRYALIVPAGEQLSYWIKISIKDKARNSSFEGDFSWLLEGCDKETLSYESLDVLELESTGTAGEYTVTVSNIESDNFNGNIVFPSEVNGDPVTTIVASSLSDTDKSKVQSVYIPSSVQTISENAFNGFSDLEEVTFEQNETASSASVQSSTGLTTIGTSAFTNCSILDNFIIPSTVTTIGETAFKSCLKFSEIDIPNSVTSVGVEAFSKCGLRSVVIGSGLATLGDEAFSHNPNLATISVDENNSTFYSENNAVITKSDNVLVVGSLGATTIPDGVTKIADKAYYGTFRNSGYYTLNIPASVTEIGVLAFNRCPGIQKINFATGSQLTKIGDQAFYRNGDTSVDPISKLTEINLPESCTEIGVNVFTNNHLLTKVSMPGVTTIGKLAFQGCIALEEIDFSDSLVSIGEKAFYQCSAIKEIELNSGTTFGIKIFESLNLEKVTIGPNVTNLSESMFASNKNLDIIDLSNATSLKVIGDSAFYNIGKNVVNGRMTTLTIPEGVTSIGNAAFYGIKVTNIQLPSTLQTLGSDAFAYSSVIETVEFAENNKLTTMTRTFYECSNLINVNISNLKVLETIGESVFRNTSISSIIIPDTVKTIDTQAFYWCVSLTSVTIGSGVETIGEKAFYGCRELESAIFNDKTTWTAGTTSISETQLSNVSTAATYLRSNYKSVVWTKA